MSLANVIFDFGNVINLWRPHLALTAFFDSQDQAETGLRALGFYDWNGEQDRGRSAADGLAHIAATQPEALPVFAAYLDNIALAHSQLVPGTSELIERLAARGVGLFGLTNASVAGFDAVCQTAPAIRHMQDVALSSREGVMKPDPTIFTRLLERNDLSAEACLFVDDSAANVAGAKVIGMDAVVFTDAATLETDLIKRGLL